MINFDKLSEETEREYLWRVGVPIELGTAGVDWNEATPFINKALWNDDVLKYKKGVTYQKQIQCVIPFYEEVFSQEKGVVLSKQFQTFRDEIYKEKKQLYDQRREYNKVLAKEAREKHLFEELEKCASRLNQDRPLTFSKSTFSVTDQEVVVCFADFHYGMVTDNIWNKYNTEICRNRLSRVVEKMCTYISQIHPQKIHILLLGDSAHGAIHTTARVAAEEDTCDQIMHVSELLAQAIHELAQHTQQTIVYSTYGNHLRTIQDKRESKHSDNIEKIIPWWIRERFKDCNNIIIKDSEFKEFIKLNVCGYNICGTHGDLDNIKNLGIMLNTIFTKRYGETIDYTISADKHHLESFESFDIDNILVSSLCGTDDYANEHRFYSNAAQTMLVFNEEDGKLCQYNIRAESRGGKNE